LTWNIHSEKTAWAMVRWACGVLIVFGVGGPHGVAAQTFQGRAHRVIDGDTIHLLRETGQIVRIELYGIDAPERGQPFGTAAIRVVRRAVSRQRLEAVARDRDREGRPLFVLRVEDRRLNDQLLREGLAWWDRQHAPSANRLQKMERDARTAENGLWAQSDPVPPWTWRARREE